MYYLNDKNKKVLIDSLTELISNSVVWDLEMTQDMMDIPYDSGGVYAVRSQVPTGMVHISFNAQRIGSRLEKPDWEV
jgi:hypothetical protein